MDALNNSTMTSNYSEDSMDVGTMRSKYASNEFGSDASSSISSNATKKTSKPKKRKPLLKGTQEYQRRREKNNQAVKKSRIKSKEKMTETQEQVNQLVIENGLLNSKVASLAKEFDVLKELYQTHASLSNLPPENLDLSALIQPESSDRNF